MLPQDVYPDSFWILDFHVIWYTVDGYLVHFWNKLHDKKQEKTVYSTMFVSCFGP